MPKLPWYPPKIEKPSLEAPTVPAVGADVAGDNPKTPAVPPGAVIVSKVPLPEACVNVEFPPAAPSAEPAEPETAANPPDLQA